MSTLLWCPPTGAPAAKLARVKSGSVGGTGSDFANTRKSNCYPLPSFRKLNPSSLLPAMPNGPTQHPVWLDLFLAEASKEVRLVPGCAPRPAFVPAAPLVGIETNPGPGPPRIRRSARSDAVTAGLAGLGAALAGMTGKPRSKPQAKRKAARRQRETTSGMRVGPSQSSLSVAPVNSGVVRRSIATQTFSVPFTATIAQISTDSGAAVRLQEVGLSPGDVQGHGTIGVSPFVITGTSFYPSCFPSSITNLAQSFSQFRVRPGSASLAYNTTVPSSSAGTLAIAAIPADQPPAGAQPGFRACGGAECSLVTPVWAPSSFFASATLNDVIPKDWQYCDFDGTITTPETRQGMVFTIAVSGLGVAANTVWGTLQFAGVLEFRHLQDNAQLAGARLARAQPPAPAPLAPTAPASASSSSPPLTSPVPDTPGPQYELVLKRSPGWLG